MQTATVPPAGSSINMPGGGAGKTMKTKTPVNPIYLKKSADETGKVDAAKVAALKSNPKRPAPLKRKSKAMASYKKSGMRAKRKEAAEKYKQRSEQMKKDFVYMTNALERKGKKEEQLKKKQNRPEKKMNNCTMMYSVGPQPVHTTFSAQFRAFRKMNSYQPKKDKITYLYKVGAPVVQAK